MNQTPTKTALLAVTLLALSLPGPAGGESEQKAPPSPWMETLARLNAQWHEKCADPEFVREGPVTVQIGSVEALAFEGEEITLPVRVKGVCDLAAATVGFQLDRYVAELVRVEPMPFLAGDPPVDLAFQGLPPDGSSQIVSVARPSGAAGVHGIGTLVRLTIRARKQGVTEVRLVRPRLYDAAGEPLEVQAVPLRLTVMEAAAKRGRPFKRRRPEPRGTERPR